MSVVAGGVGDVHLDNFLVLAGDGFWDLFEFFFHFLFLERGKGCVVSR